MRGWEGEGRGGVMRSEGEERGVKGRKERREREGMRRKVRRKGRREGEGRRCFQKIGEIPSQNFYTTPPPPPKQSLHGPQSYTSPGQNLGYNSPYHKVIC